MPHDPLSFDASIGSTLNQPLALDAPQQQTIGSPADALPEERASGFRNFVERIGLTGPSLLNSLSLAFGQSTQEIANRRRSTRRRELEDQIFEREAKLTLAGRGGEIVKGPQGRSFFAETGKDVIPGQQPKLHEASAGEREFQSLLKGLSPEEAEKATRVKLGLDPRAVGAAAKTVLIGGVPHIFDPVAKEFIQAKVKGKTVTAETVGEAKGTIAATEARKKGRVVLSNKVIDKGFAAIGNINANIRNIDRALGALSRGAKTGAIERFLPNITKASVELGQIQKELGLDIIGAVTFGALSKGELDLALSTALPVGLNPADLTDFLTRKKSSQEKLRDYYRDQIEFLDGGGSVAEFTASQKGDAEESTDELSTDPAQEDIAGEAVDTGRVTATGGKIFKKADGSLVVRE